MMDTKARMEQGDTDSISTISGKDFTPLTRSPSYLSEAPPAYRKGRSSAVQIAKIISWTVVAVSFILGGSIIFSAWIQTSSSCASNKSTIEKTEALNLSDQQNLVGRSLIEDPATENSDETIIETVIIDHEDPLDILNQLPMDVDKVRVNRMPLEFLFDDLFGDEMMENNHRANMNCFVEKKKTDEMEEQSPKNIPLPFGLNLTTDPKFIRTTGEKMMVVCESGSDHINTRSNPVPQGPFPGPMPMEFMGPMMGGPMQMPGNGHMPMPGNGPIPFDMLQRGVPMGPFDGPVQFFPVHGPSPVPLPFHPQHNQPQNQFPLPMRQGPFPLPMKQGPVPIPVKTDRKGNSRAMNIFEDLPMELRPPMEGVKPMPPPMARAFGNDPILHLIPPVPKFGEARPMRPEARSMPVAAQFLPPLAQPIRTARMDVDRTPNEAHFIQPRSVDAKKRQKRCTCDCAC